MRCTHAITSALAVTLSASTAPAAITAFWQTAHITATTDAVTPAPGISGFQSWDLMITLTAGDDFTSFRILFDPPEPIFHHSLGAGGPNFGPPNSGLFPTFPVLEFDSYLRGPADGVTVLGSTDGTNDLPPPGIFNSDRLAVAAGDLSTNPGPGTFQLLRITWSGPFPNPTDPNQFGGRVFSVQQPEGASIFPPEPGALLTIAVAGGLAVRRLRASHRTR